METKESVAADCSLPSRVLDALRTNAARIKAPFAALLLWERVLTESDRLRLGDDCEAAWRQYGTAGMWCRLRGVSAPRAVVDVAHALGLMDEQTRRWLLRELGEIHDDPDLAISAAVASVALVLVERPRTAYWEGHPIPVNWDGHPALWDFLWELCHHAKAGRPIDHTTFPASKDVAFVTKQKSRLLAQHHFPQALGARIKPVGRNTQKLDLPSSQIRLFELSCGETLKEHTG